MKDTIKGKKVLVTGHNGMVGSAISNLLQCNGAEVLYQTRSSVDLLNATAVTEWFEDSKPQYVIHCAAKVGGIIANQKYPSTFLEENLLTALNVVTASRSVKVDRLCFVATNCVYPKDTTGNLRLPETKIFDGAPDESVKSYAVSKIAGIQLCLASNIQYGTEYYSLIPPNLYGVNDNYDSEYSHVVAGIIRRVHDAKTNNSPYLKVWGSGKQLRELLYVDDFASAIARSLLKRTNDYVYNVGPGVTLSIFEITRLIAEIMQYTGDIISDNSMPEGAASKILDCTKFCEEFDWAPSYSLRLGLNKSVEDFLTRL